jgi:hypothetical protein
VLLLFEVCSCSRRALLDTKSDGKQTHRWHVEPLGSKAASTPPAFVKSADARVMRRYDPLSLRKNWKLS